MIHLVPGRRENYARSMQTETHVEQSNSGQLPPGMVERRHRSDPRRDYQTRAMIFCQAKLQEVEHMPDGPKKTAALAEVVRLMGEKHAGASDRRHASTTKKTGWTDEYFFP